MYRIFIALSLVLGLAGCAKKEPQKAQAAEAPPVRASAIQVKQQVFQASVAITGTLVSTSRVDVKAETVGKVVKFPKEEGDVVTAGEAVAWVDDSVERIAERQAETAVRVAETAVERAKVLEGHSRAEYTRAQNLLGSGGITDRDYKTAELANRDAHAQVAFAAAQLEQAKAQLESARKMVADSIVRAPVSGEIQTKIAREGSYVEHPTPVFSIVDNSRLELESMVATSDLGAIRSGQNVTFTVNAFPNEKFSGRVIEVNPSVEASTRSAKTRIRVNNANHRLKAGMFVQGEILTGVERQAVVIPLEAVYRDDRSAKTSYVLLVENGKAVRRNVRIGRERDNELEIAEGLKPGDVLLTTQSIELAEGVRVAPQMSAQ